MQTLEVIAEIDSTLHDARKDAVEYSRYNAEAQNQIMRAICSIHPLVHSWHKDKFHRGLMTGIDDITEEAFAEAMDGWGRPTDPIVAYWYSQALNQKINADQEENRRIAIYMLRDMGDGDELYRAGSFVYCSQTWAILATRSGFARHVTPEELELVMEEVHARRAAA